MAEGGGFESPTLFILRNLLILRYGKSLKYLKKAGWTHTVHTRNQN
jgi:hypothetical protein